MDLRCIKCGEPWEMDYLHEVAKEQGSTFARVADRFAVKGCEALGGTHNDFDYENGPAVAAIYDLLGDDIDGAAALIEDFGL